MPEGAGDAEPRVAGRQTPPTTSESPPAAQPATVEDLLRRLERGDDDLRSLSAEVTYRTWDAVLEKQELRVGTVVLETTGDARRLGIAFDELIVDRRKRKQRKQYVFDEGWLVEIDHERKMFIKQQIVRPGERFDPLALGEGPFPLPIGQAREQVLARFEASLLDRTQDPWLAPLLAGRQTEGLLLIPKPGAPEARDIARVELFYDLQSLVPVGVHVVEPGGDTKTAYLRNQRRNEPIDPEMLRVQEPDPRLWQIDIRPWREAVEGS
jgi:hypothetical protein